MKIILIGIQGAGKSTQGNLLSKELDIPYLSTGHIFRALSQEKTPLGRYIKETITAGVLIPDDKTLEIVSDYLKKPEYQSGYIMDGFPRTVGQAQQFENHINYAVYLEVSDKEALWRLSGRDDIDRTDNTIQALRKRIDLFHEYTRPVIDWYREKGKLVTIDGEQDIETIFNQILTVVKGA